MKIIYCICETYNPGGMERVLLNKINYLVKQQKWDITVVTTDQHGKEPFYPFPKEVRMIDLNINYSEDNGKEVVRKIFSYLVKRHLHKKRLTQLLKQEKADIVVSLYPSESSFIPFIKDGSRKVLELHYCKYFRLQYGRNGLLGFIDRLRTRQDENIVRKFDRFIVLTEEDKGYWGQLPNLEVIPNAALTATRYRSDCTKKRIIAVGRLDYQKGFDRLIDAWNKIQNTKQFEDWHLDIFGQGEWKEMLEQRILNYGLTSTTTINSPTKDIGYEYANSSLLVMSSHYEGFPMVMIEAMAYGLPVISFDFKCGPRDIIINEKNGIIVTNDDIKALAEAMMRLMRNEDLRQKMSIKARNIVERYSETKVMNQWITLFEQLKGA